MFLIILQVSILILILVLLFTQVIVPFKNGTPFFPIFSKEVELQKSVEGAKQSVVEAELRATTVDILNKADSINESVKKELNKNK